MSDEKKTDGANEVDKAKPDTAPAPPVPDSPKPRSGGEDKTIEVQTKTSAAGPAAAFSGNTVVDQMAKLATGPAAAMNQFRSIFSAGYNW